MLKDKIILIALNKPKGFICTHKDEFNLKSEFICNVDFPYVGQQEYNWLNHDFQDYYDNISNAKTFSNISF